MAPAGSGKLISSWHVKCEIAILALIASYEIFPTQEKHRVFIAGWSREQSDEVYQAILEQLHHAPILKGKYTSANYRVKNIKQTLLSSLFPVREARGW